MKRASQRHLPVYVSQISITPLLDLVLVLLLVFVVAVPFLRREKADALTAMPPPEKPANQTPESRINLRIQQDQSIRLDGKPVSGAELLTALKARLAEKPESGVLVLMPENFAAGSLARLMEEMHRVGVRHTAVEVLSSTKP